MITSLPLGYTILVRSHAKCYSILTRASKRIELITRTNKKKKKKEKKPEQIQSCAEGNLENNLATITTRLWGGIKRNERDTLLSAAVHNWTKQFLSETDVVTWESARARTRWSNQQNAYQAISSPFCRTLLHNLIYFFPSVYKSLPELLWILISRRRLDACPLRLGPL